MQPQLCSDFQQSSLGFPHEDVEVFPPAAVVAYAYPQRETVIQEGGGRNRYSLLLKPHEQLPVHLLCNPPVESRWLVPESDDIQGYRCNPDEMGRPVHEVTQVSGLADVLGHQATEFFKSVFFDCQPDLQRLEPPRKLGALEVGAVGLARRTAVEGSKIVRAYREGAEVSLPIPDQDTPSLVGSVHPLVEVERQWIRSIHPRHEGAGLGGEGSDGPECSVNVEP